MTVNRSLLEISAESTTIYKVISSKQPTRLLELTTGRKTAEADYKFRLGENK